MKTSKTPEFRVSCLH